MWELAKGVSERGAVTRLPGKEILSPWRYEFWMVNMVGRG